MEDLDFILFHFIYLVIHLLGENYHICQNTKMGWGGGGVGGVKLMTGKIWKIAQSLPILINKVLFMEPPYPIRWN